MKEGEIGKAISLMRSMPLCQKLVAWRTVLNACKNWGSLQDGQVAFEHAVHLDKEDAATYVLMAHTYACNIMVAARGSVG
ncbi:hypothetical protein GOP47_0005479 [Adiantum capillus-veneris]|uniref:Pentatricopeptide repeat-containing protein n=1 Tax=Adiantum capillus-veneris TaxID=13818 RepID=A0A9D4V5T1_ADICA|nr:hypothetical protein GOP47_0005479 [Adiantum capillus-veneris]